MIQRVICGLVASSVGASMAFAQLPKTVLVEGQVLAVEQLEVSGIYGFSTNSVGGYVIHADGRDLSAPGKRDFAWGHPGGGVTGQAPGVLFEEGLYDGVQQSLWSKPVGGITFFDQRSSPVGIADSGQLFYIAQSNKSHLFVEDRLLLSSGDVLPAVGGSVQSLQALGVSPDGRPFPFAQLANSTSWAMLSLASPDDLDLPKPLPWSPVLVSGQQLPNLVGPLPQMPTLFDLDVSNDNYFLVWRSVFRSAVVMNGEGLMIDESVLEFDQPVPLAFNAPGKVWREFFSSDLNQSGDYAVAASFSQPGGAGLESVVIVNGSVVARSGDVIEGFTLPASFGGQLALHEDGSIAFNWGNNVFYENRRVIGVGSFVDSDQDGLIDPVGLDRIEEVGFSGDDLYVLGGFAGFDSPCIALEFDVSVFWPMSYCDATESSLGCLGKMEYFSLEVPVSGAGDQDIQCTQVQDNRPGIFFWGISGPTAIPFSGGGTLCVQPPLGRTAPQFSGSGQGGFGDCTGLFTLPVNQAGAFYDFGPGTTTWFQVWMRDPTAAEPAGTALSNGLEVNFK